MAHDADSAIDNRTVYNRGIEQAESIVNMPPKRKAQQSVEALQHEVAMEEQAAPAGAEADTGVSLSFEENDADILIKQATAETEPFPAALLNIKNAFEKQLTEKRFVNYNWMTVCVSIPLTTTNPYALMIAPVRHENGEKYESKVPLKMMQYDPMLNTAVKHWSVPDPIKRSIDNLAKDAGSQLQRIVSTLSCKGSPDNVVLMTSHNGGCKLGRWHIHCLIGSPTEIRQLNAYKQTNSTRYPALRIKRHKIADPTWAILHHLQMSDDRQYLGTNHPALAADLKKVIETLQHEKVKIHKIPEAPTEGELQIVDDINYLLPAEGEAVVSCSDTVRKLAFKAKNANQRNQVFYQIARKWRIGKATEQEIRECIVHGNHPDAEVQIMTGILELPKSQFHQLAQMYLTKIAGIPIDVQAKEFLRTIDEQQLLSVARIVDILDEDDPPYWFSDIHRAAHVLLGKGGKRNTVYVYGAPSLGKTRIYNVALDFLHPIAYPSLTVDEHTMEELAQPHVVAIFDDVSTILVGRQIEMLKQCFGGQSFPLNVKYQSNSMALTSPVIFLSNTEGFRLMSDNQANHLEALDHRMVKIEMREYPMKADAEVWQVVWAFLLANYEENLNDSMDAFKRAVINYRKPTTIPDSSVWSERRSSLDHESITTVEESDSEPTSDTEAEPIYIGPADNIDDL